MRSIVAILCTALFSGSPDAASASTSGAPRVAVDDQVCGVRSGDVSAAIAHISSVEGTQLYRIVVAEHGWTLHRVAPDAVLLHQEAAGFACNEVVPAAATLIALDMVAPVSAEALPEASPAPPIVTASRDLGDPSQTAPSTAAPHQTNERVATQVFATRASVWRGEIELGGLLDFPRLSNIGAGAFVELLLRHGAWSIAVSLAASLLPFALADATSSAHTWTTWNVAGALWGCFRPIAWLNPCVGVGSTVFVLSVPAPLRAATLHPTFDALASLRAQVVLTEDLALAADLIVLYHIVEPQFASSRAVSSPMVARVELRVGLSFGVW